MPIKYDIKGITKMKEPLLKYIYYTFLESEKISDEFSKFYEDFIKFVQIEICRLQKLQQSNDKYNEYFFENFLFVINAYLKCFNKDIMMDNKGQNDEA